MPLTRIPAGKLQQAIDDYNTVVSALADEIAAIRPLNKSDRDSKYNAAVLNLEAYIERGGDTGRISNYDDMDTIKIELDEKLLQWAQEETEAAIQTRTIGEDDYFVLTDENELNWFFALVNGTLETGTAQDTAANAILDNDIVINEELVESIFINGVVDAEEAAECSAIDAVTTGYVGIFDGAEYTISGLYLPSGTLFDTLDDGAHIKDLQLYDAVIGNGNGGIVRIMNSGSQVTGCTFSGVVSGAAQNIGGIAGEVQSGASVTDCMASGLVKSTQPTVGGIAGSNNGMVSRCGAFDISVETAFMLANAGGVVGLNNSDGTVKDCYVRGALEVSGARSMSVAGVIAENRGTLENCYSACTLPTNAFRNCGYVTGINTGTVNNCYYMQGLITGFYGIGTIPDVAGQTEVCTDVQFADGTVTIALGEAFVQNGSYPELVGHLPSYSLTVINGEDVTDEGPYQAGTIISIKADDAPSNQVFNGLDYVPPADQTAGRSGSRSTVSSTPFIM